MTEIFQFYRALGAPQPLEVPAGVNLRTYRGPADTAIWLQLRHRAFARARVGVRQWDEADFSREFLTKPWWRPDHLWIAEFADLAVGTVSLAMRGTGAASRPVVHWLAVLPAWRRRGIGRLLMHVLEARAWELGYREVWLETHGAWAEAVELYRKLGYRQFTENPA